MASHYWNTDKQLAFVDFMDSDIHDDIDEEIIKNEEMQQLPVAPIIPRVDKLQLHYDIPDLSSYQKDEKRKSSIKHYIVSNTISNGAFGEILKVSDIVTKEKYAYKRAHADKRKKLFDVKSEEKNEIDIMSRCVHPNIISMVSIIVDFVGFNTLHTGVIMELGDSNLSMILKSRHVPTDVRKMWSNDVISAVKCLHKYDYVHCDLKTNNILIMNNGSAKLADFGLATHKSDFEPIVNTYFNCGVLAYRPPEYITNVNQFTGAYRIVAQSVGPLIEVYKKKHTKTNFFKSLISGELFSLGMVLLDIYTNYELLSKLKLEVLMEFILRRSLYSTEARSEYIKGLMRNPEEHDPEWAMLISKLTRGDPKKRLIPFSEIKISGIEHNEGDIRLGTPIDYKIDDMILYTDIVKIMTKVAIIRNYNIWQLSSSLAYFRYILPNYIDKKGIWHYLAICSLAITLGLQINTKVYALNDIVVSYSIYMGIVMTFDKQFLLNLYTDIYVYMNGVTKVLSTSDLAQNGLVSAYCLSYYILDKQPDINQYVEEITHKILDTNPTNLLHKNSSISNDKTLKEIIDAIMA